MKTKNKIFKIIQEEKIDPEIFKDVLFQLIDLMEYNGDDTYLDIKHSPEQNKAFQFLKELAK